MTRCLVIQLIGFGCSTGSSISLLAPTPFCQRALISMRFRELLFLVLRRVRSGAVSLSLTAAAPDASALPSS